MTLQRSSSARRGFTLVEVLVAAALSMLIMVMVTVSFQKGMGTLSQLKSIGEMQQRLRNFEVAIRGDLEAEHFESRYGPRLSDQRADLLTPGMRNDNAAWRPPTRGFFRIMTPSLVWEGSDPLGNPSTRATDHVLHMTVRRYATRGDKLFSAKLPTGTVMTPQLRDCNLAQMSMPNTLCSEWAEVAYFLDLRNPAGTTSAGGLPLYGLYRRVRVLPADGKPRDISVFPSTAPSSITTFLTPDSHLFQGISNVPVTGSNTSRLLNSPEDIRNPRNRLGGFDSDRQTGSTRATSLVDPKDTLSREESSPGTPTGSDLLLSDVISFEIKADWDPGPGTPQPLAVDPNNYEFPFNYLPVSNWNSLLNSLPAFNASNPLVSNANYRRVFDTWYDMPSNDWLPQNNSAGNAQPGPNRIPQLMRIRTIQIKVRVWDRKHNLARQITIVQNM